MNHNKPKITIKLENESFKVLQLDGIAGDKLSTHKVDSDAILQILTGEVIYQEDDKSVGLFDNATLSIAKQQLHELEFVQDSTLLLFLSKNTKITFSR